MTAALKLDFLPIADIRPDPRNARVHDDAQVELIIGLVERFGWTMPMLVDVEAEKIIVAGHCRRLVANAIYAAGGTIYLAPGREHGGKAIPDGTVPVIDCSGWPEEKRQAYNLADNRSAETSTWDLPELQAQLAELAGADFDPVDVGFNAGDLDAMLAAMAESTNTPPTPPEQFPEFGDDIDTEHKCPKCGYEWSGKAS